MVMTKTTAPVFDDSPEEDDLYKLEVNEGLSEELLSYALKLQHMTRGLMIVTGMPGSGKDTFGNVISYLIKTIYKNKKVFRDEPPRRLYGDYELFDEMTVMAEFAQISEEINAEIPKEISRKDAQMAKKMADLSNQWMARIGDEKLNNSILYLTEFHKYMHNRKAFSPIGILLGRIIKRWRHLNLLVLGTTQQKKELDKIACLPFVTHEIRCAWSINDKNVGRYKIYPVKFIGSQGVLEVKGKPKIYNIDGRKPREFLDDKCYFNLFNSLSKLRKITTAKGADDL